MFHSGHNKRFDVEKF